jgi:general secretion pathway protein E
MAAMDELAAPVSRQPAVALAAEDALFEERLLGYLLAADALSVESAERARRAHARAGSSVVDILIRLGLCEEKALARAVAQLTGLRQLRAEDFPQAAILADRLSVPFLREARAIPIEETETAVVLATVDPDNALNSRAFGLVFAKPLVFVVATASEIDDAILRLYSSGPAESQVSAVSATAADVTDSDIARLRESAGEAPIVRFVERLIANAIDAGASDIHIEPLERRLRVRSRIDGMLADEDPAPLSSAPAIVSRIKILARLDIAERRLPQDGSIKMNVRGREIDLRVATAPVVHGESVAIRILDKGAIRLDLPKLGFGSALLARLQNVLERPNGIVLVTGPTGSGKSTTLYAALDRLNTARRKIVTVEDPVEYKIDGLNQIQVKPEIGLDFARALRSILRHDPDVIMVGEIRDAETARIATQAALTGHLVLSTLHTNDAASAVTRLMDMGVDDYLITSTLTGVVAQRLVRTLCSCRRTAPASDLLEPFVKARREKGLPSEVFEAAGCPACRGSGYRGRTIIAEMMVMDGRMRESVLARAEASKIRSGAMESGMQTLYENGIDAVFAGTTSFEEVLRVAQDVSG